MTTARLAPLLEVQDLDLAARAAQKRSDELPERALVPQIRAKGVRAEGELAAAQQERAGYEATEEQLGESVAQIAKDMETAEVERYSGKQKSRDDAKAHDASQAALREKKAAFEEQEMELLESIEGVESRIDSLGGEIEASLAEIAKVLDVIGQVEREIAGELEGLAAERAQRTSGLPAPVLSAYERVRDQKGKAGRGAASFEAGDCHGCQIKLPTLEKKRLLAEPEDAVIQCPQCRRVLVRV